MAVSPFLTWIYFMALLKSSIEFFFLYLHLRFLMVRESMVELNGENLIEKKYRQRMIKPTIDFQLNDLS